jgi:hypothetical protein
MASTLNADNGVISGSAGLKSTADSSGVLALQTNGTTGLTLNTTQALGVGTSPSYGTSGQVLTSAGSGAAPTWTTPSVGAMTLISTLTASSSASFEWTGLSGYDKYFVIFDGITGTNSVTMQMQVGTGSGPTYLTSNYSCSYFAIDSTGATSAISSVLGSVPLSQFTIINSGTSGRFNGFLEIGGMINGADASAWWHTLFVNNTSGNTGSCNGRTFFPISNTTVKTAIKIYMSSGNITSGKATLYGLSQ